MKIKMQTTSAGPDGVRLAGREYDVPEAEAADLLNGGYAVPADGAARAGGTRVERAIAKSDPEHATSEPQGGDAPPAKRTVKLKGK